MRGATRRRAWAAAVTCSASTRTPSLTPPDLETLLASSTTRAMLVLVGCLVVVVGGDWWLLVVVGGDWWRLVVVGGGWWWLVVIGGGWWGLVVADGGWCWLVGVDGGGWLVQFDGLKVDGFGGGVVGLLIGFLFVFTSYLLTPPTPIQQTHPPHQTAELLRTHSER